VSRFGGEKVPARVPGEGKLKALEDAPGSYAKLRLDAKKKKKDATADVEPTAKASAPEPGMRAANDPGAGSPLDLLAAAAEAKPEPPAPSGQKAGGEPSRGAAEAQKP
jgi:polyhydroxyalkanoate synthase